MDSRASSLVISPGHPLRGEIRLPGDKSISLRAALLASLADGESHIAHFLVAGVTQAMLACLTSLGVSWHMEGDSLCVQGKGLDGLRPPCHPLDCGNSATTLRLLAGALAAARLPARLDGSPGLRRRPMTRVVEPLRLMGVDLSDRDGCAPIRLKESTRPLQAVDYALPVASAQVKSCLLLAALAADGPVTLREPGPSRDHTERLLGLMGVTIEQHHDERIGSSHYFTRLIPPRPLRLKPLDLSIPGDFSSAAFLLVAGLVTPGSEIRMRQVGLNPTRTGLLDALVAMGADISLSNTHEQHGEPVGDLIVRASSLKATRISGSQVVRMIDEFPALAVAASHAEGLTRVMQAEELRLKESDRISQLCAELSCLGVEAHELADGFAIRGRRALAGGSVQAHGDHRLAMALALAGLSAKAPVSVDGVEVIGESFPEFVPALQHLGAHVEITT